MAEGLTLAAVASRTGGVLEGDPDVVVTDVTHDSSEAAEGSLFVAIKGFTRDGHLFVHEAVDRGASAVCVEERQQVSVPQILVADGRVALASAAAAVHGDPSHKMDVVGVTGTNGKTTVTRLLEAIGVQAGRQTGIVGTLGAGIRSRHVPMARTTPEASDLQRLLAEMVDVGVQFVAMEVSSHALALHRVDETRFRVAGFTNLGRDHLDFHGDIERYFSAKQRLFRFPGLQAAAIWTGDPAGERLAHGTTVRTLRVGRSQQADVWAEHVEQSIQGSRFVAHFPHFDLELAPRIPGDFNVDNALMAAACAHLVDVAPEHISEGIASLAFIPGRFQVVSGDDPRRVIVDFAHTPDSVRSAVRSARSLTEGSLIVVLGAGGDRDTAKRPLMGNAASAADVVIVTSDNPRSEQPSEIAASVADGVRQLGGEPVVEIDRRLAIRRAVKRAQAGDLVLILGKGHEMGQEIGEAVVPFSDRDAAIEELMAS